jgi:hypothetical protein
MDDFASITAVCVDTLNHEMALIACERMAKLGFAETVLVTDEGARPHLRARPVDGLRVETIAPLRGRSAYSQYVLKSLPALVATSHALIFQWDGFVLEPFRWDPAFMEYDYIGGLFPPDVAAHYNCWVGNGGFCLRSSRLMQAAASMLDDCEGAPEDTVICVALARALEQDHGIRFAPPDVAMQFSVADSNVPANRHKRPDLVREDTFGFHGFFNFHLAFGDEDLVDIVENRLGTYRDRVLYSHFAAALLVNLATSGRQPTAERLAKLIAPVVGLDAKAVSLGQVVSRCDSRGLPD